MRLPIRVRAHASRNHVARDESGILKIYVTAPAEDGKANEAVRELLAREYGVSRSRVKIIRGEKSKDKVVDICPKEE